MGNKTIIYVLGPTDESDNYYMNKSISFVKIGMTKSKENGNSQTCALKRVREVVKTGMPYECSLYDVFDFPCDGKVDDKVRQKLVKALYPTLNFSAQCPYESKGDSISPGREFVYNVCRYQIQNAINVCMLDVLIDTISSCVKQYELPASLSDVYKIFQNNYIDRFEVADDDKPQKEPSFWLNVKKKCGLDFNDYGRTYILLPSRHENCFYKAVYLKSRRILYVEFESYAKNKSGKKFNIKGIKSIEGYRDIIQSAIELHMPKSLFFSIEPLRGTKRLDKWAWRSQSVATDIRDDDTSWVADSLKQLYNYFENLDFKIN